MSLFGTPATQGLAGAHAAAHQAQARPIRKEPGRDNKPGRAEDEVIMGAERAASVERVHSLAGNDQEDARQDHQEHPAYSQRGQVKQDRAGRIDTSG